MGKSTYNIQMYHTTWNGFVWNIMILSFSLSFPSPFPWRNNVNVNSMCFNKITVFHFTLRSNQLGIPLELEGR